MSFEEKPTPLLGVLGGLGPMATVYFYELVTAHTKALKDQDHLNMIISSHATTPDRTAFILGKSKDDPFEVMEDQAERLVEYGATLIAIPCNTAHYFYTRLNQALNVPILNMVGDTVNKVASLGFNKVGILATDGTIETGTYQRVCEQQGVDCAVPDKDAQKDVMHVIYSNIKKGEPPEMPVFERAVANLQQAGCDAFILGCTELSLVKKQVGLATNYVDSMEVLAEHAILACNKEPIGFNWR